MTRTDETTILIVEDEGIVANDIRAMLDEMGYSTCGIAASSDEARAIIANKRPDLVLMDIRIKGTIDGIATAELLRAESDIPVVYLTAHADEATLARAKVTEPYGYLIKPVHTAELRSAVEIALHRYALESRVREREKWFSTTVNSLTDGVATVDLEGRIIFLNPAAEALTGFSSEQARGKDIEALLEFVDSSTTVREVISHRRSMGDREMRLRHQRTGEYRSVVETAAPVLDGSQLLGGVVVLRDVTESHELKQQLEAADRLASLGTMAAGVAHEINNPLAAVVSNAEVLSSQVETLSQLEHQVAPEQWALLKENIGDTKEALHRIARIVSDLRTFARHRDSGTAAIDLAECATWAIRATASEFRHRAPVSMDLDAIPFVRADRTRLEQVLVNLLVNAAQAISPGRFEENEVRVSGKELPDGFVRLRVSDTGSGIPKSDINRIFEPFFTTKDVGEGSGLGLSICQGIITSFGGSISVESQLGSGTTVTVLLPVAQVQEEPAPPPVTTECRSAKVLLVDDDDLVPRAVRRVLDSHRLVCVSGGSDALAVLARDTDFDVILSDLMMPGMTGKAFYEALQEQFPRLVPRVVFLTGGATSTQFEDFLMHVPNQCVEKPFEGSTLKAAIARLLNGSTGAN